MKLTYPWNFPLLLTEKTSMTSRDVLKASSKISEFFFCVAQSSCVREQVSGSDKTKHIKADLTSF